MWIFPTTRSRPLRTVLQPTQCILLASALAIVDSSGSEPSHGARTPAQALQSFQVAPSLRIESVAAEPLIESPCALAFDEKGRLYVAENRGYPRTENPPQGRIALLIDSDGDGKMDQRSTFAEGLAYPNGVLPWRGGILVTAAPDFLFLEDTDGDGVADRREVLLTGFDTARSTQLRVNAPTVGPDGWIYLAAGLSGGTLTNPQHPDYPPLKMTGDVRWNPQTGAVENIDGRSQYGQSFDDFGQRFICMNRIQVQHVVLKTQDLRRHPRLAFSDSVQNCPDLIANTLMRSSAGAARLYPVSSNLTTADSHAGTFSAACAVMIWRGGALPKEYLGAALSCDPTANLVHADRLSPNGSTFAALPLLDHRELLASTDDWFRPVFLSSGPDGALYVCDMYRKIIEHPDYLPEEVRKHTDFVSGKNFGRIWRIRSESIPPPVKDWSEPAAVLAQSDGWNAQTAFRLLAQARPNLKAASIQAVLSKASTPSSRAALLEALGWLAPLELGTLNSALTDPSPGVRSTAVRLLPPPTGSLEDSLFALAEDLDPKVRLAAALRLGDVQDPRALLPLAALAISNTSDRWMRAAILSGLENREYSFLITLLKQQPVPTTLAPMLEDLGQLLGRLPSANPSQIDQSLSTMTSWNFDSQAALLCGYADARSQPYPTPLPPAFHELLNQAQKQVRDDHASSESRVLALRLLRWSGWESASAAALPLLDSSASELLGAAAIRLLAGFLRPEVASTLLNKNRWPRYSPAQRETILATLLGQSFHADGILAALESGAVPANAFPALRRTTLLKHKDPAIQARASKIFDSAPADRKLALEQARSALSLPSNPSHGREIFKSLCATCHRLDHEGHAVGPDLFDIRNQPKENILFHIVAPDAEVAPAFTPYLAETRDGRVMLGLLASESANSVTLRMPLAQEETILRSNLSTLTAQSGSLMPAGLDSAISKQDLADLLAYLKGEQ